jgi:N-acetylmuramoyl-L-alanine amidase
MTMGRELAELAGRHVGERYILGVHVPKDNASWKGPWDCAEFASWVVYQCVGVLVGCTSNSASASTVGACSGAWARDAEYSLRRISLGQAKAVAGAVLIRRPRPGAVGHVAISRGDGTTVEAHSQGRGVINGSIDGRRWDLAVLAPAVEYPSELPLDSFQPPAQIILSLMFPPMRGKLVTELQQALLRKGYDPGIIDGIFGPHTHAAVMAFQLEAGLAPDGEAGSLTRAALQM